MMNVSKNDKKINKKILDDLVDDNLLTEIVFLVYEKLGHLDKISQKDIVTMLKDSSLTYKTIARVVKEIIPTLNPTANSIRALVVNINKRKKMADGLLDNLIEELK